MNGDQIVSGLLQEKNLNEGEEIYYIDSRDWRSVWWIGSRMGWVDGLDGSEYDRATQEGLKSGLFKKLEDGRIVFSKSDYFVRAQG